MTPNVSVSQAGWPSAGPVTGNWMSSPPGALSQYHQSGREIQSPQDQWILNRALQLLGEIRNLPQDEQYIRSLGVQPVFQNGGQALQAIRALGTRVEFGDMGDSPAHAQWIASQNLIMINRRYRGDTTTPTLYAISEAIYHEAGHAWAHRPEWPGGGQRGDDQSSVQEELNCLALNTLANRYHQATDSSYAQVGATSRLISDGVALYSRLFFDPDPYKRALVQRVADKYGDLPLESPGHALPAQGGGLARCVAMRVAQQQMVAGQQPASIAYWA